MGMILSPPIFVLTGEAAISPPGQPMDATAPENTQDAAPFGPMAKATTHGT
jgi:hypothetical protein